MGSLNNVSFFLTSCYSGIKTFDVKELQKNTALTVHNFLIACKEGLIDTATDLSINLQEKTKTAYRTYSPIIKTTLNEHKLEIISSIAASILFYTHPLLTVAGSIIGYVSNNAQPNHQEAVLGKINTCLIALGGIGTLLPACSLGAVLIVVGTIGCGRIINNLAMKCFLNNPENVKTLQD